MAGMRRLQEEMPKGPTIQSSKTRIRLLGDYDHVVTRDAFERPLRLRVIKCWQSQDQTASRAQSKSEGRSWSANARCLEERLKHNESLDYIPESILHLATKRDRWFQHRASSTLDSQPETRGHIIVTKLWHNEIRTIVSHCPRSGIRTQS